MQYLWQREKTNYSLWGPSIKFSITLALNWSPTYSSNCFHLRCFIALTGLSNMDRRPSWVPSKQASVNYHTRSRRHRTITSVNCICMSSAGLPRLPGGPWENWKLTCGATVHCVAELWPTTLFALYGRHSQNIEIIFFRCLQDKRYHWRWPLQNWKIKTFVNDLTHRKFKH